MGKDSIGVRQCELESILLNHRNEYEPNELANMEEEMFLIHHIYDLWLEFGGIPMNQDTKKIESKWNCFPAGTHREEIWHWFEDTFGVSVAEDLMVL